MTKVAFQPRINTSYPPLSALLPATVTGTNKDGTVNLKLDATGQPHEGVALIAEGDVPPPSGHWAFPVKGAAKVSPAAVAPKPALLAPKVEAKKPAKARPKVTPPKKQVKKKAKRHA